MTATATATTRIRSVTWEDPRPYLEIRRTLSGIDSLQGIRDGRFPRPPFAELIGLDVSAIEPGRVVFCMTPDEYHFNPMGSVHGGMIATLLDSAMGCAVQTLLPAGTGFTTLEIKVNYLKAILPGQGLVFAEGTVIHQGRTSAVAEGRVYDEAGTRFAIASTTCAILQPRPAAS